MLNDNNLQASLSSKPVRVTEACRKDGQRRREEERERHRERERERERQWRGESEMRQREREREMKRTTSEKQQYLCASSHTYLVNTLHSYVCTSISYKIREIKHEK